MYPFPPLRAAYDRFWHAVRSRVGWLPEQLEWDVDLFHQWTSEELIVGYTCGWPLVTELRDLVTVLGAFAPLIPDAEGASYRSVLIAGRDGCPTDFGGTVAAVNDRGSMSGWVSLLAAVHGPGSTWEGEVRWTGSHLQSVRAVHDRDADIASIDAVSLAHIRRLHPDIVDDLVVVGHGARVPCLPVVAGPGIDPAGVAELRVALAAAVQDPALDHDMAALLIAAFVPLDLADYLPLLALAPAPG
jgi:ABC-type phosphate/phosphonate transport system substrate-binding protein